MMRNRERGHGTERYIDTDIERMKERERESKVKWIKRKKERESGGEREQTRK